MQRAEGAVPVVEDAQALAARCQAFFARPFHLDDLLSVVARYSGPDPAVRQRTESPT